MGKDMFKLGLNLLIISAVAALLLALTNSVTASTIAQRNEQANAEARKLVLESAQDFEQVKDVKTDNSKGVEVSEIYEAKDASGNTVGYTLKVLPSGYGGTIELMVGIDSVKGQVSGIKVLVLNQLIQNLVINIKENHLKSFQFLKMELLVTQKSKQYLELL